MSLQHVSISGYLLVAVIELPSNAQHWSTAESQARAAGVWRRTCWRRLYYAPVSSTREKRGRCYLVLVSRETGFPGEFVEGQGKSSLRAKDSKLHANEASNLECSCKQSQVPVRAVDSSCPGSHQAAVSKAAWCDWSFCRYLAPEILSSRPYGKASDWWTVGILMYELMVGKTPFIANGINRTEMFRRIQAGDQHAAMGVLHCCMGVLHCCMGVLHCCMVCCTAARVCCRRHSCCTN